MTGFSTGGAWEISRWCSAAEPPGVFPAGAPDVTAAKTPPVSCVPAGTRRFFPRLTGGYGGRLHHRLISTVPPAQDAVKLSDDFFSA
ncbi:MAG: hypothetical protein ABI977_01285 [Acidobacteriota bacterium]